MRKMKLATVLLMMLVFLFALHTNVKAQTEKNNCKLGKNYTDKIKDTDCSYYTYKFKYKTKIRITVTGTMKQDTTNKQGQKSWKKPKLIYEMDNNRYDSHYKMYIKDTRISLSNKKYSKTLTVNPGEICLDFSVEDNYLGETVCNYKVKVDRIKEYKPSPATKISMIKSKTLYTGDHYTIKPKVLAPSYASLKNHHWTSSNWRIATVDSKGKITAKRSGSCTITCRLKNGKRYKCKITVKTRPVITINGAGFDINCVGGVEPYITVTNKTNKTIKYIDMEVYFYNTVGDPAYCSIFRVSHRRLEIVGPFYKKSTRTYYWDAVIYNYNTAKMKIKTATVTYMDNKKTNLTINKSFKY